MTDNELLQKLQADDKNALKAIFHAQYPMVYRSIFRLVSNKATAEDLSQDVFMRFWEKRKQLNIKGAIGAYMRRMAINEALGYIRKHQKKQIESIADYHSPQVHSGEDAYLNNELKVHINKAIEELPPRCKKVFVLSRFEDMTYKQIGAQLNISPKTVENQISKALRHLRGVLNQYMTTIFLWITYFVIH